MSGAGRLDLVGSPGEQGGRGRAEAALSEGAAEAFRRLAAAPDLDPDAIVRAAWALLLSRHLGASVVRFETAVHGGPGEAPGAFPLDVEVVADESFLELAKRARCELERPADPAHAGGPFEAGAPESFAAFAGARRAVDGEPLRPLDLRVFAGEAMGLELSYDASRFDPATMLALARQCRDVFEQAARRPELPVGRISLVTSEARDVLPDPTAPLDVEELAPVATLVEDWARRAPGAPALSRAGKDLSYGELCGHARAVAGAVGAGGFQRGDVVALDGQTGFGLLTGLLGILRAGGVVVVLDRRLPLERRRLMCREAAARHFVRLSGEPESEAWWSGLITGNVVEVDLESGRVHGSEPRRALLDPPEVRPDEGAYIFFTSGTTGVPKVVLGTHRGLSHFVAWQRTRFGVGPGDRSSQLTGLSFDVVLREIFLPLTSGATLCLPDDAGELGPERVLPWLERERITILHTVPALAGNWLLAPVAGASLASLRRIFFAGEPLSGRLVKRWRETFGAAAQIVNLYGPTETTLAKCFHVVPHDPGDGVQPVGRPLPSSQALVLADGIRPCGIGEWGEIAIRTPYRTRGYVNSAEETRRRFRANPLLPASDDLVYYTGDRGRFRADGVLEISGRLDDQVKISGVRVEPGEIAAALGQCPRVRQGVVLARSNALGDLSLAAYVVPTEGDPPSIHELIAFLRARLPPYMVPSSFVVLERLPLTANGKVDRAALAKLDGGVIAGGREPVAPRTATEKTLARIWAEVLGLDQVGLEDNFFDLGGQSLLITRVLTLARQEGFDLEPVTLLQYPTVRTLARHLTDTTTEPRYEGLRERALRQRAALARRKKPLARS